MFTIEDNHLIWKSSGEGIYRVLTNADGSIHAIDVDGKFIYEGMKLNKLIPEVKGRIVSIQQLTEGFKLELKGYKPSKAKVRWVVQSNLTSETYLKDIQEACKSLDVEFNSAVVVPFSHSLPAFIQDEKVNVYFGSTTFMYNLYKQLKPKGLFFDESTFTMENYLKHWKQYMLNGEAKVTTFKDFVKEEHTEDSMWFIRPNKDNKSFDGNVLSFSDIKNFFSNNTKFDNVTINKNTQILVGPPYNIKKEWRNYIVNGKVVASSLYRENFKLKTSNTDIPINMIEFVEARCKEYSPHNIFVMDIALCGDTYYIIECGCMNSAGFYKADVYSIVKAISNSL